MKFFKVLMAAFSVSVIATAAVADTFPSKPVRVVMPYPPGVGPDAVMRMVGERLAQTWKQQVIVENRPGGNGWIGVEAVKRSAPDGYTFLLVDQAIMSLHPYLYKKLTFDAVKDFEPVAPMYSTGYFLTVSANSRWNSVGDLLKEGRTRSTGLSYGSSGVGGQLHIGGAMLESFGGLAMTHVPYKDVPQMYVDVGQGNLDFAFGTPATLGPLLQSKRIKLLAYAGPTRHPRFPDVPTIGEAGGPPEVQVRTWIALFAPKGTPSTIVQQVNAEVIRILGEPEVKERLASLGTTPWPGTARELAEAMKADSAEYAEFIKRVKLSID
jgi:tripartite-type tricarboxylate transporter receptor subunit TctC